MISGMALVGPGIDFSRAEDFRKPWSTIVNEDNVAVSRTARLLECHYLLPNTKFLREFKFWYRKQPAGADANYLSSRMNNHPLLRVGAPLNACPISADDASVMLPLVPTQTLKNQYSAMLKQVGDADDERAASADETRRSQDAAAERAKLRRR